MENLHPKSNSFLQSSTYLFKLEMLNIAVLWNIVVLFSKLKVALNGAGLLVFEWLHLDREHYLVRIRKWFAKVVSGCRGEDCCCCFPFPVKLGIS